MDVDTPDFVVVSCKLMFFMHLSSNVMPHYPPPGQWWGIGGDLNFAKFKCTTYWACQLVKSQPSPHSKIKEKMGNLISSVYF